jgi:lysophospholipase L1-like esterase
LAQGGRVRRSALRLPEPIGERSGVVGQGTPLRLLVLGDSAAAGVGAPSLEESLIGHLVRDLSAQRRVDWRLIAKTGATTASTLRYLSKVAGYACDVVVTSLGVNDVTSGRSKRAFLADQAALLHVLRRQLGASLIVMSGLPPMGIFPVLPQPLRWYLGTKCRSFDASLQRWVQEQADCRFTSLSAVADTSLIAADGFHPSPGAYRLWAERAAHIIRQHSAGRL